MSAVIARTSRTHNPVKWDQFPTALSLLLHVRATSTLGNGTAMSVIARTQETQHLACLMKKKGYTFKLIFIDLMMKKNKTKPQVILGEMRKEIDCHIFALEL